MSPFQLIAEGAKAETGLRFPGGVFGVGFVECQDLRRPAPLVFPFWIGTGGWQWQKVALIFYDCSILKLGSDDSAVHDGRDVSCVTPAC